MLRRDRQLVDDIGRLRRQTSIGIFAGVTAFVLFEALRGHTLGSKITGEGDLWNYGSSLLYFVVGEIAIVNAILIGRYGEWIPGGQRMRDCMPWVAAGLAFTYFACDEMLSIHEKLGSALERSIPWVGQAFPGRGDSLIMACFGIGAIAFSLVYLRSRIVTRSARLYFIAGFAMIATAIVADSAPHGIAYYADLSIAEEVLEIYAAALFASAFLAITMVLTRGILITVSSDAAKPVVVQPVAAQPAAAQPAAEVAA